MTERPVDEADLHGFVDGRLDAARHAVVAAYLADHPDDQARVQDWMDQAAALRLVVQADDGVAREVIVARLAGARVRRSGAAARRWAIAASVLLALAVGGAGGWVARGDRRPTEIARLGIEAASAYRVFANDTARPIELSSEDPAALTAWMTQKLGRRVPLPDLAPMGYHLMGGRVLTAMYGPAAMLLYRDAADNRITVYVQPMRIGLPAPMQPMQVQAVDGYAWIERQVGYSVMSDGDRGRLHLVADQVRAGTES